MTTRILRLLLLAALAWPTWTPATAQEVVTKGASALKASLNVKEYSQHPPRSINGPVVNNAQPLSSMSIKKIEVITSSTTVCDGTNYNQYVPIYGYYIDTKGNESQMIYPESLLPDLSVGDTIKAISFYAYTEQNSVISSELGYSTVQIYIGKTTQSAYSSNTLINKSNLTRVYQGTLPTGSEMMTITFSSPYVYEGGNLIIDTYVSTRVSSHYATTYWAGTTQSSYSSINYNGSYSRQKFLPKITIEYVTKKDIQPRNIVVEDEAFFESKIFDWTDSTGVAHTSKLNEIATDPDQMIAMVKEIYTNKSIPGNLKRGFDEFGKDEAWNDCYYTGVGTIERNGSASSANSYSYVNDYGWNIPGNTVFGRVNYGSNYSPNYMYYCHMDTTQYRPEKEGLTLLLAEMVDDYSIAKVNNALSQLDNPSSEVYLRTYFKNTIKSLRVITQHKRVGDGFDSGTLFKIDCDKMNKFFLLAKGQLRFVNNSNVVRTDETYVDSQGKTQYYIWGADFCAPPANFYFRYTNNGEYHYVNSFNDEYGYELFYHMFEQFSPVATDATSGRDDIYQDLINMESFGVQHDCASVSGLNHQFMMYGDDSSAADCQDVRDMMFFVPDYRMLKGEGRDTWEQKFLNYNTAHQPTMGLYVIRQDPVTETTAFKEEDNYYHLTLTWDSNLDEFLPSNQQEYQLYEVKTDPVTGEVSYVPVYYTTVDANGNVVYADANGQALAEGADPIEVTLTVDPSNGKKTFVDVYVQREVAGKIVTYAIRGQDKDHFLSLQMSNEQSYIIKGLDPGEMVLLQDATHYSRFDAQNVRNCYSNKLMLKNNPNGIKPAYLAVGTKLTISRQTATNVDPSDVAVIEVTEASATGGKMSITLYNQDDETMFPIGAETGAGTGKHAGYHHNTLNDITYTVNANGDVDFGTIVLFDNFVVDVSQNNHPSQYIYKVNFTTATAFEGINGENRTDAYSNAFRIRIFKTNSKINNEYSLINVKSDKTRSIVLDENTKFSALTQYNSKTEVLRYDAYRWNAQEARTIITSVNGEDNEVDIAPTGIAGNQGEYYTVTMNDESTPDYYVGNPVYVSTTGHAWADFVDVIPTKEESGVAAYVYAPVAESFTFGKDVNNKVRKDYNTYGGPLQTAAIGKLEIVPAGYEISRFSWLKGEGENAERYAYYNVELKVEKDEIPQGYEIYMIRAWRQIDEQYLDEYEPLFLNRKSSDYLFEEMLGAQEEGGEYQQGQKMLLGSTQVTSVIGEDDQPVAISDLVYRGTFGARKVVTSTAGHEDANDHCIDKLKMNFIVRIYFTPITSTISSAPGMSIQPKSVDNNSKFYIAEYTVPFTITGGIATGIESVQARQVAGVKYYNVAGVESDRPFKGVNIVVTRYSDGSMSTTKIVK